MNTITHIFLSINWIDVVMLVLFIRIVFIGVKTGFVTELFKLFGILCALFVGLNYYVFLAAFLAKKAHISLNFLEFLFFVLLVSLMVLAVKFFRDGFLMLFKFEASHERFDQWGAGVLSIFRALLIVSLVLYGALLTNIELLQKQTMTSVSHKLALKVAPNTYSFLFHNFIGKIFSKEKFNDEVLNVSSHNSVGRK
ncbi:MAG: CvpA family protein [Candidatus Omnitrophota bacterium]